LVKNKSINELKTVYHHKKERTPHQIGDHQTADPAFYFPPVFETFSRSVKEKISRNDCQRGGRELKPETNQTVVYSRFDKRPVHHPMVDDDQVDHQKSDLIKVK